jgi:type I restriction enzyme S subunit
MKLTMATKKYKQTEVGVIPNDWEFKNIASTSTLKARIGWQGLTTSEYLSIGDYFLVTGTDFFDGKIKWETCHYVNKDRFIQDKNIQVKIGDILITKDGTIGKVAYVDVLPLDATLNSGVFVIRPKDNSYDPLYCYYIFNSAYFDDFLRKLVAGSTINHLYQKDFVLFNFPLPPTKSEQTAIANALSDADALISSLEKLIEKKRNIKQGAMQQLLKPKKGWVVKKFKDKDVTNLITCGIAATPEYVSEFTGYPFLSSTNVKDGKIVWSNYKHIGKDLHSMLYRNNPPQRGDILYSRVGTIGEAAIVEVDFEFSVYVSLTLIKTGKLIHNEYLKHLLNSDHYKKLAQSTVLMGGGVGNLNVNVVREWDIPIPPINEQKEIAEILNNITEEISALEKKLSKSKMLKQGMMQELLTGKIRLV